MKVVFFGTPQFATPFLQALIDAEDFDVAAVVCQPDKPIGRKKELHAPPTKQIATEYNIPILQPEKVRGNANFKQELEELNADVFVVIAYGHILPDDIISMPQFGSVNVHPSKLPMYRGPSPLQAAIWHGDTETAITIMLMDAKMDHGPILHQESLIVDLNETTQTLMNKVMQTGPEVLLKTLRGYFAGSITPTPQNHDEATFCHMLKREDGLIDFTKTSAEIYNQFRALQPWPGVYTIWDGKRVKISNLRPSEQTLQPGHVQVSEDQIHIGTADASIQVPSLQIEGKKEMTAKEFLNGYSAIIPL